MKTKFYLLLPFILLCNSRIFSQYVWSPVGNGANLGVQALAADTNNDILYLGGIFTTAGVVPALGIAQWDGASYSGVGGGILSGIGINSLYMDHSLNRVVAGGSFLNIGGLVTKNIAAWDGSSWIAFGPGLDVSVGLASVDAIMRYNGEIYAGGTFTQAGLTPVNYIAKWDGSNWQPLTSGTNGAVKALCVYNNELYVGGTFTNAGGVTVSNIAKWDGTNWSDVGGGVNYTGAISVSALEVYNGDLYAGGTFTSAGTTSVNHIARWDGSSWSDVDGGADYTGAISVSALEVFQGDLVAGGSFDSLGSVSAKFVGKFNGTNWSPMGLGMNLSVKTLCALKDTLYAGGDFTTADANVALFIAQWKPNGTSLTASFYETGYLTLYPNPVRNNLYVSDPSGKGRQLDFTLFDAPGRKVLDQKNINGEVRFEGRNLSPGLYFYKITDAKNGLLKQGKVIIGN